MCIRDREKEKYFPEECFIRPSSERKHLTPVPHRHPILLLSLIHISQIIKAFLGKRCQCIEVPAIEILSENTV